ncbi:hypothetical protein ACVME8_000473 [Bradyrhizobium diazoefficiens]
MTHHELHRHGDERAWWTNLKIAPLPVAQDLWAASPVHGIAGAATIVDVRFVSEARPR